MARGITRRAHTKGSKDLTKWRTVRGESPAAVRADHARGLARARGRKILDGARTREGAWPAGPRQHEALERREDETLDGARTREGAWPAGPRQHEALERREDETLDGARTRESAWPAGPRQHGALERREDGRDREGEGVGYVI